ncbi:MAG: DUF5666 domain-containing protein [Gammaproteobacteria bacterium]|nr:DUF5666 domain-containing protein [Gammaproteobacteria bacterium]
MNLKYTGLYAAMISAMIGLAACSSSNNNGTSAANVTGRITGFGSVYVDGVEYETNGTSVSLDGIAGTEADLHVGMLVTLTGSDNGTNGNAVSITFNDELEGVVTQTVAGGGLIVMGQNITVDNSTNIEDLSDTNTDGQITIDDLALGDNVEISGYPDGTGGVHATFIEMKGSYTAGDEIEVKGLVSALDSTAMTFTMGQLTVDYSAADLSDAGALANGLYVEVKSTSAPVANILSATKVEQENNGEYGVDGDDGDELEVEGLITALDTSSTPNTISVNGQTFDVPAGIDISGYAVGDMIDLDIEVSGTDLIITDLESEEHDDAPGKIEIKAIASATDTVNNTITVAGITISVDPSQTIMLDHSDTPEQFFNLGSITEGTDRVKIEAIPNADNSGYIALSIERSSSNSTTVELEGPVSIDVAGVMSIAGVILDTTSNTAAIIPAGIIANMELHANGVLNSDGTLAIAVIEIDD